jgi:hypothetical protein
VAFELLHIAPSLNSRGGWETSSPSHLRSTQTTQLISASRLSEAKPIIKPRTTSATLAFQKIKSGLGTRRNEFSLTGDLKDF